MSEMEVSAWQDQSGAGESALSLNMTVLFPAVWKGNAAVKSVKGEKMRLKLPGKGRQDDESCGYL